MDKEALPTCRIVVLNLFENESKSKVNIIKRDTRLNMVPREKANGNINISVPGTSSTLKTNSNVFLKKLLEDTYFSFSKENKKKMVDSFV